MDSIGDLKSTTKRSESDIRISKPKNVQSSVMDKIKNNISIARTPRTTTNNGSLTSRTPADDNKLIQTIKRSQILKISKNKIEPGLIGDNMPSQLQRDIHTSQNGSMSQRNRSETPSRINSSS